ncbi:GNAT family N-acetyltransferase [Nesterenkonia muleiensis]|uniref:GNAT family N-acetyltransferase n=1 Tax=Nesterenkonia muleiensis TaxID=2282648 RepID=UPI000E76B26C|nr:GNAT family N-acetyltransferase [Nesterenkonia muleiensis]
MNILGHLDAASTSYSVHRATVDDVADIVALLADDPLGATRETATPEQYREAFHRVEADAQQHLLVIRDAAGQIVGTAQLTFIPYLVRGGTIRVQVEAVRLASQVRGSGLGTAFFEWIHQFARNQGAQLVQLTSDKSREAAQRFYEQLGYAPSHIGFKRSL